MIPVLAIPQFRAPLLEGLVVSIGGLSESLVRHSSASFIAYINSLPPFASPQAQPLAPPSASAASLPQPLPLTAHAVLTTLCDILAANAHVDRVSVPALETLDLMFGCGAAAVRRIRDAALWQRAFALVQAEVYRSRDVKKLLAGAKVFCGFVVGLSGGESCGGDDGGEEEDTTTNLFDDSAQAAVRRKALAQLVGYLAHPYPKVRRAVAELLYLALTSEEEEENGGEDEDTADDTAQNILLATDWDLPAAQLKDTRDRVKTLLLGK
ncbi:hypothetical protein HDU86_008473 [Geranomyces michiganensis]|nr:hypothetical protein HDU86_008473 [Geranomyces michiganensis]